MKKTFIVFIFIMFICSGCNKQVQKVVQSQVVAEEGGQQAQQIIQSERSLASRLWKVAKPIVSPIGVAAVILIGGTKILSWIAYQNTLSYIVVDRSCTVMFVACLGKTVWEGYKAIRGSDNEKK
jgi:hypothetical protein